jgi:multiple sugar transport system ATP-binding protein
MASLELRAITKAFGAVPVLRGVDLTVGNGEFLTLVGPSGCGKSTLLRVIAGLEPQDAGTVAIGGAPVDHLRPHERKVAMVFQSYALYPHMTVFNNIALPLTMSRLRLAERVPLLRLLSRRRRAVQRGIAEDVRAAAAQLGIPTLLDRRPAQLSGGQRQRVALGRALVRQPDVFLMDEPLSNLDAKLRVHMRTELAELHARLGATFVYVTHDQVEAMTVSDRVAVLDGGEILQVGTPAELYERPANLRVAEFIGSPPINTLPARVGPGGRVELPGVPLPIRVPLPEGSSLSVGLRPEALEPVSVAPADGMALPVRLRRLENHGAERVAYFDLVGPARAGLICRVPARSMPAVSDETTLRFDPGACHLFGSDGARVEPVVGSPARLDRLRDWAEMSAAGAR